MYQRLIFLLLVLALAACDQAPAGRYQLALVPESIIEDMGRQTFAQMGAALERFKQVVPADCGG